MLSGTSGRSSIVAAVLIFFVPILCQHKELKSHRPIKHHLGYEDLPTLKQASTQDPIADLANALAAAQTDHERAALISKDKKLLTPDLERLLIAHGEGLTRVHKYDRALALYQIAFEIAEQRGSKPSMAHVLSNRGLTLWQMGDYTQALGAYQRSMLLLEEIGDKLGIVRMFYNLGLVHTSQGNYDLALEYDRKYLAAAEALGDKRMIAQVLPGIGIIYSAQGDYFKAMQYYEKALAIFQALGDRGGAVAALLNIAGIHSEQNNFDLALEYQQKALTITQQAPTEERGRANRFAAGILLDIAGIYGKEGNYAKSLEFSLRSLEIAQVLNNSAMIVGALGNIGESYQMLGNQPKALESFQQALTLSEKAGDRISVAQLLARLGRSYEMLGNYTDALRLQQQSSELANQLGDTRTLWFSRTLAGRAHQRLNQQALAFQAFEEAITIVEKIRLQVAGDEVARGFFFEDKISPYQAMIALLVAQDRPNEAFRYTEKFKARALLDVLKGGSASITKSMTKQERDQEQGFNNQLVALNRQILLAQQTAQNSNAAALQSRRDKLRRDYEAFQTRLYLAHPGVKIGRGDLEPIQLGEAAALLPDATYAALEFMVDTDKTYVFVLTKGRDNASIDLKVYALNVEAKDLGARAEKFREQLAQGDLEFQQSARELYDVLLKPAQSQLQNKNSLIIVPDGPLWNLPFQALQSEANRYVLEDQSISYAPSLTVLREMVANRKKPENQSQPTLLALGNPALSKQTAEDLRRVALSERLEPLPETEKQVKAIAQLYGASETKVYTGSEAREDRVKNEAGRFRILQFATHGVLNNRSPMYSYLVFSQDRNETNEDGLLETREVLNLDLNADLVVLSACETGRGKLGAGEGIVGMSWALFVAGSPATVVSQWKVESASTTELMLGFHRNLKSSTHMTKATALQQSAINLMRNTKFAHPFYWAGFVVMGNGF